MKGKTQWKKSIAFMVSLMMLITMIPLLAFGQTNDFDDHWASEIINKWMKEGLISGYPDGSFRPNNPITRAEFMVLTNKAFAFVEEVTISFEDVNEKDWFTPAIKRGIAARYISGYPDGSMGPNNPISRQETAVVLTKIMDLSINPYRAESFSDAASIQNWSKGYIGAVAVSGFMSGYPDGSFKPATAITRAEALVVLDKARIARDEMLQEEAFTGMINKAGTYGPETVTETFEGDIYIQEKGITLQNILIKGDLFITEEVGDGEVYLNNITVEGDTYIRGGGIDSIHINDGSYSRIIIQKTGKGIRVLAMGTKITTLIVYPETAGNEVILNGNYDSVTVLAEGVSITTQGNTNIKKLTIGKQAKDTTVATSKETIIDEAVVDSNTEFNNQGRIIRAIGTVARSSNYDVNQPENLTRPSSGGGGGSTTPAIIEVSAISITPETMTLTAGGAMSTITATVSPENATNKNVIWLSSNPAVATVNGGVVTPVAGGTVTITATSAADGIKSATCVVTVNAAVNNEPKMTASPIQVTVDSGFNQTFTLTIENDTVTNAVYTEYILLGGVFAELNLGDIDRSNDTTVTAEVYGNLTNAGTGTITLDADALVHSESNLTVSVTVVEGTVIPVSAITVIGAGDVTTIDVDNGTLQMSAAVLPTNASNKSVTWSVADGTGSATISVGGLLTAVTDGTVTVTATSVSTGAVTGTLVVTISNQLIPSTIVFTDAGPIAKTVGDAPFTNAVTGGDGAGAITYVSGTPATATVDAATGQVTIVAAGSTIITATKAATATHAAATNTYTVNVNPAPPATVTGIAVKTAPTKTVYTEGENLELAGLEVTLTMSDASEVDVSFAGFGAEGITTVKADGVALVQADASVVITHTASGQTATQAITVNPAVVAGPPSGQLLDADSRSGMTGVLYTRDGNIYYNQQDAFGTWGSETQLGIGTEGKLVFDLVGHIHVAYTTDGKIGYRKYNGAEWAAEMLIVSNHSGTNKWPDIDVDAGNNPHIIYVDSMGDTAGTQNQPDVMYAYKNNGTFTKHVLYSGNYDSDWKEGRYPAEKKPLIAMDENNNQYVFYQWRTYDHGMGVNHDRGLTVAGATTTQSLGHVSSNTDRFDIYDFKEIGGKLYALYRDNTNIKVSEMTVNSAGEIVAKVDLHTLPASSAYSIDVIGSDIVIGSKDGNNLRVHYNENPTTYNEIVVKGNAVSIVNLGGTFYAFYTDNADDVIKRLAITD
ncbi:S-layer homology domain-containing protein [Natronincola peptidivorans]|uniref:S-layer homology domain-containing protein n=1 Tax=Natronincola peptidivorans TaxID=426128 RepID=A0A1I0GGM1_9FIRM|nr:S-layer homology domain-containing protein [Natronincola peptidivorans]SET70023.1 S-layer homology domain-containing protein [Natronincola peptidivorans]